jgi:hypothetical protein
MGDENDELARKKAKLIEALGNIVGFLSTSFNEKKAVPKGQTTQKSESAGDVITAIEEYKDTLLNKINEAKNITGLEQFQHELNIFSFINALQEKPYITLTEDIVKSFSAKTRGLVEFANKISILSAQYPAKAKAIETALSKVQLQCSGKRLSEIGEAMINPKLVPCSSIMELKNALNLHKSFFYQFLELCGVVKSQTMTLFGTIAQGNLDESLKDSGNDVQKRTTWWRL